MANPTTMADTKVRIGEVRFSYLHVFTPDSVDGNEPKYSVSLIIPKGDTALVDRIKAAIKTAYQQGLQSKWGGKAGNWRNPLRDGDIDRPDDEAYRDSWFINASSKTKPGVVKPGMVDGKPAAVAASEEEVYSGCYGYASLAKSRSSMWFWGRFCICTSRPAHRPVLDPWNWKSPWTRPSAQTHRSIVSYFLLLVLPSSILISSALRSGEPLAADSISVGIVFLSSLAMGVPSRPDSHSLSWVTLFGLPSPVSALASALRSALRRVSARAALRTSPISTSTPRSLIRWSSA